MQKYLNASVKKVLEWAEKQNFSSFQPQNKLEKKAQHNYEIEEIRELENENLKEYLHSRGLSQIIYPLVKVELSNLRLFISPKRNNLKI